MPDCSSFDGQEDPVLASAVVFVPRQYPGKLSAAEVHSALSPDRETKRKSADSALFLNNALHQTAAPKLHAEAVFWQERTIGWRSVSMIEARVGAVSVYLAISS